MAERTAFQKAVLQALQLPRIYWEVFVLCDIQENSIPETARILGIEPDLATKRLRRARQLLLEWQGNDAAAARTRTASLERNDS